MGANNDFNYFDHYEDMTKKYGEKAKYILTQTSRKLFVNMQIHEHIEREKIDTAAKPTLTFPVYRYVEKDKKWKKWECSKAENERSIWGQGHVGHDIDVAEQEFEWIDGGIWNFIDSYAKSHAKDSSDTFAGSALYWVVLKETDFKPQEHINLPSITGTQVYIGRAASGIRKRWTTDTGNHCQNMFDIFKDDENKPLVDARLLLANLRKECMCIFAVPCEKEELQNEEAMHIDGQLSPKVMNDEVEVQYGKWTPVNVLYGMNMKKEKVQNSNPRPGTEGPPMNEEAVRQGVSHITLSADG